ncbi:MAG: peptide-N-glycosidase F-related protein [Crocinitomicaceae bacterium]
MKTILLLFTLLCTSYGFSQDFTVNAFTNETHMAAGTYNQTYNFPTDNSMYDEIIMNIALTCPAGGCDPWDRFATIKAIKDGEEFEIGRYITPYGNNWCNWTLDVTEYREILNGTVELESFIETWSNGWDLTVSFDYYLGTPDYEYVDVANIWVDYDFAYGDTIFFSIDLPEKTFTIPSNAEKTVVRIVNTGHGQGNTENAAEFSQKTHDVLVNGNVEFNQFLWNSTCSSNPCSPQGGTWTFARAGWCPGAQVDPSDYDVTSMVTPGSTATFDYELEPFFNECSPWNPSCSNGTTCTECTYNGNGHTPPNYKISAQLITYSSTPVQIANQEELAFDGKIELYPNPSREEASRLFIQAENATDVQIEIATAVGTVVSSETIPSINGSTYYTIPTETFTSGTYLVRVSINGNSFTKKLIIQ